jgi:alkanesulfonate monooxygenase SsuD/methylene tetrahydromethanopterin reductase-like flavin-dependent oxidoreductase (luciferase family)
MQVGIDSFAAAFDENSRAVNPAERLRQLVQQIEHADEVGLDAFGVGEHHRREFLDSAPAVILGAAAAQTQRIRLTSAVTVLSAEDPVRAFQNFATLDLLSRGRAEMIVGRGLAARRRRSYAPASSACRSWSRSSAASRGGSVH